MFLGPNISIADVPQLLLQEVKKELRERENHYGCNRYKQENSLIYCNLKANLSFLRKFNYIFLIYVEASPIQGFREIYLGIKCPVFHICVCLFSFLIITCEASNMENTLQVKCTKSKSYAKNYLLTFKNKNVTHFFKIIFLEHSGNIFYFPFGVDKETSQSGLKELVGKTMQIPWPEWRVLGP